MENTLMILAAVRETESLVMQYVIVAVIIIASVGWVLIKLFSKKNKGKGSCCGCSLAEQCSPQKRQEHAALRKTRHSADAGKDCCKPKD